MEKGNRAIKLPSMQAYAGSAWLEKGNHATKLPSTPSSSKTGEEVEAGGCQLCMRNKSKVPAAKIREINLTQKIRKNKPSLPVGQGCSLLLAGHRKHYGSSQKPNVATGHTRRKNGHQSTALQHNETNTTGQTTKETAEWGNGGTHAKMPI